MKVYVNDPGVSSGIKNVEIYLNSNDKNGTSKTEITDGTSLKPIQQEHMLKSLFQIILKVL